MTKSDFFSGVFEKEKRPQAIIAMYDRRRLEEGSSS